MTRNEEFINKRLDVEGAVWNELQQAKDGIIEASAGTGKTYTLQHVVLKLASDKQNPVDVKNILLVTYTEKAAGELKQRIREILEKAGILPADFDEMTICTIHSFCRELLSEYAFENRVPMQLDIGGSDGDLIHRAVREALLGDEFKTRYAEAYAAYLEAGGLESTESLAASAETMLEDCAKTDRQPESVAECCESVRSSFKEVVSSTSFDFEGLKTHGGDSKFPDACDTVRANLNDLQSADALKLFEAVSAIAAVAVKQGNSYEKLNPRVKVDGGWSRLYELCPGLRKFSETVQKAQESLLGMIVRDLSCLAWPIFKRLKAEAAMLTFDDLVTQACHVINVEAEREAAGRHSALLDSIRRRYRIALVDEFQDTDEKQWDIFGKIFSSQYNQIEGDAVPCPKQGFLLVVGDPKQAIYGFRGADIKTYFSAKTDIKKEQPEQSLRKMFRSSKPLVDAFNELFGEASGWFGDMGEGDSRIESPRVEYPTGKDDPFPGYEDFTGREAVTLLESLPAWMLKPQKTAQETVAGKGNKAPNNCGNTTKCLPVFMENAAHEMKRLRTLSVAYQTESKDNPGQKEEGQIPYRDMCVLVRNGTEARIVRRVLEQEGIPYSYYKERGIYESVEAEALIALFDFLSAPGQQGRLAALLLTPLFNVPPLEIETKTANAGKKISSLFERWQELSAKRKWNLLFESVMDDTELAHPDARDYEFDRRWITFRQILDRLLVENGRSAQTPECFAGLLRTWRKNDQSAGEDGALRQKENESDSVQIMTMHASKGLEFKAVFIAAGFSKYQRDSPDELKRLFYVALTRAVHKLYLPWTSQPQEARNCSEPFGVGSAGSPLLGEGFLSKAIRTLFDDPRAVKVALPTETVVPHTGEVRSCATEKPRIYSIGDLKHLRLQWDSFSTLNNHEGDENRRGDVRQATLLPRNNVSGNVFHEIMETLCGTDESMGNVGFSVGKEVLDKAIKDEALLALVRRTMRNHSLKNQEVNGDSTELTLARMVWRALNTRIEIGGRPIFLKEISFKDRLAEVEFVIDEHSVLGGGTTWPGGAGRMGVFNGKIDLLIRPDGKGGPVYVLDWKTNSLADYGAASVKAAMEAAGYPLQFKLYSLAVEHWLGRGTLAGVAYLFVRGGEHGDESGVYARAVDGEMLANCRESVLAAITDDK
ncbi:MAG: UvrD-helicase domain-containing protein [Kiritimatiellae bacterium]|nr:UvrD-helicase domain-containing protein [Kiritimatiellia bacterium]